MTKVINTPEKRGGLRASKKARTRAHLISVAIDLFSRNGIDSTTVEQIALEADVGKGTVYNYFASKEDIIVAFMADLERRAQPAVRRFSESDSPIEGLLAG